MSMATRSYVMSQGTVKLGSRVKDDYPPGVFVTPGALKEMKLEQKRSWTGGKRTYGTEYDDYYQNRRWDTPSGSMEPSFLPVKAQEHLQKVAKRAVQKAIAKVVTEDTTGDKVKVAKKVLKEAKKETKKVAQEVRKQVRRSFKRRPFRFRKLGRTVVKAKKKKGLKGFGMFGGEPTSMFLTEADFTNVRCSTAPDELAEGGPEGAAGLGFYGLGAEELPDPETVDLVTAVREIYATTIAVKPLAEFVGTYPILSVSALMMVVGAWAGLASYIGAGGVDVLKQLLAAKKA